MYLQFELFLRFCIVHLICINLVVQNTLTWIGLHLVALRAKLLGQIVGVLGIDSIAHFLSQTDCQRKVLRGQLRG